MLLKAPPVTNVLFIRFLFHIIFKILHQIFEAICKKHIYHKITFLHKHHTSYKNMWNIVKKNIILYCILLCDLTKCWHNFDMKWLLRVELKHIAGTIQRPSSY